MSSRKIIKVFLQRGVMVLGIVYGISSLADPMPFADSENLDSLIDRDSKISFAHQVLPSEGVIAEGEVLRTSLFEITGRAVLAKKKRLESQKRATTEMVETINVLQPRR